jgi:hypothetical protein
VEQAGVPLPEAVKTLAIRGDLVRVVDAERRVWRFQHVPNLVGEEGSVPVVQKLARDDLLLVGTELAVHDEQHATWVNRRRLTGRDADLHGDVFRPGSPSRSIGRNRRRATSEFSGQLNRRDLGQ